MQSVNGVKKSSFSKNFCKIPSKTITISKCSHRRCSIKKSYSQKFRNIRRKTPVLESLFNNNFIKKRLQGRCFPVNITKFLRTPNFEEHLRMVASGPDSFWVKLQACSYF